MNLIIEGLNYYNLGFGLEETCRLLYQKFGVNPEPSTLSSWTNQYSQLCRYSRLRPFAIKMYKPEETVEVMNMAHRQIYRFRYHRAKMQMVLQEFKNQRFGPLKEYLEAVSSETPHQYFQDGLRISEIKTKFDKAQMIIYLEQARGIYGSKLDFDLIEDLIKKYAETQTKIFRLEKAWQKFTPIRPIRPI